MRIAILDDYQRRALGAADWASLGDDVEITGDAGFPAASGGVRLRPAAVRLTSVVRRSSSPMLRAIRPSPSN